MQQRWLNRDFILFIRRIAGFLIRRIVCGK
jgi:hypothetical protein